MAYVEPRYNKDGVLTHFRLMVSVGMDYAGKQKRKYQNWTPPDPDMDFQKLKKLANEEAIKFEKSLKKLNKPAEHQTFAEYAQYVLDLKKRNGLAPTTYERYQDMLAQILPAIGQMKLQDVRPQHLNDLYAKLAECGSRSDTTRAVAKRVLKRKIQAAGTSKGKISRACHMSQSTLNNAIKGIPIQIGNAEKICAVLGYDFSELFTYSSGSEVLSTKTILEHHRLISTIFTQADKELLIPYNPAKKASPPRYKQKKADYYQPEEMEDIVLALEDAPLKWKAMTYVLIDTGCRRGELMGLQWKHINFENNSIMIEQALLYTVEKGTYIGPPKNGQPRSVFLAPESIKILHQWHREQMALRIKNRMTWTDTDFVFTKDDGTAMHPDSITAWLNDFSEANDLPHIHPHAFRHTVASILIANGVDLVTTAAELGHSAVTTTMSIYAHQIAKTRAKAGTIRAGVFATVHKE